MKPLVIRHDPVRRMTHEITVPDPHHPHQHRKVRIEGRGPEMLVHGRRTGQHVGKMVRADADHHRQPDRRPQRIAPADTFVKIENPVLGHTPLACGLWGGGNCHHARAAPAKPVPRQGGVAHRLGGGEGFGSDNDKRCVRCAACQHVVKMRRINVGDVMHIRPVGMARQRGADHRRPKVGAADADIDHIRDAAVADLVRKGGQTGIFGALDPRLGTLGHMHDRTVFGLVDMRAGEQRLDLFGKACLRCQLQQHCNRFSAQFLPRQVDPQVIKSIHEAP